MTSHRQLYWFWQSWRAIFLEELGLQSLLLPPAFQHFRSKNSLQWARTIMKELDIDSTPMYV